MDQITLGDDKITCPAYIVDGLILIDGDKKFTLRKGFGNALNRKMFRAIGEDDRIHPDIHDLGCADLMHYIMKRHDEKRSFLF